MIDFDTIIIQEMSKENMLLILQALSYTGEQTKNDDFMELRDNILNELATLAEISREEFIEHLSK